LNTLLQYDEKLFLIINNDFSSPSLDGLMSFFTTAGDAAGWVILGLVAIVMTAGKDVGRKLLTFILTVIIASLILHGAKMYFDRDRPLKNFSSRISNGEVIVKTPIGPLYHGSFPSGHAQASFTVATFFALYYRHYRVLLFLAAAAVAFSRVYLGVHYPSDVLAGAILGWSVAFIVFKLDPKTPGRA